MIDIIKRFEEKYTPVTESGCWLWEGAYTGGGRYGTFWVGEKYFPKMISAHRASLFLYRGELIPSGKCICHTCDIGLCVNPNHLFIGDHRINMRDMVSKGRHRAGTERVGKEIVEFARSLRKGGESVKDIAKVIGVSPSHTSRILRGISTRW
jgi:hypothetical protein